MIQNIRNAWVLIAPYWRSDEKWKAWLFLAIIISLSLGEIYIVVLVNRWNNGFYNALQNLDRAAFFSSMFYFIWLALCSVVMVVYKNYMNQMLQINWRRWLTKNFLKKWLHHQNHYRMQLVNQPSDNPDQRISEDIALFIDLTVSLSLGLLSAVVTLFSFLFILWNLSGKLVVPLGSWGTVTIPGYMVLAAVLYAVFGTYVTSILGRPLIRLNFDKQKFEADFRHALVRFRENSEPIAFYKGERQEKRNFRSLFAGLFKNYLQIMRQQRRLTWFTAGYFQGATIFPFLVAAPRFFAREIQLGGLMQTVSAFGQVQGSLSYIINVYSSIAIWKASIDRLSSFTATVKAAKKLFEHSGIKKWRDADRTALALQDVRIDLPNQTTLLSDINITINPGDSLLITGPSGCGKSTLLRTLAGIWPFAQGELAIPAGKTILFLPQNPYLPLGNLREVLCYPNRIQNDDEIILNALKLCQLEHLSDRLNDDNNWPYILSPGERQRIAFARALINKADFIFLDEATSAVNDAMEAELYAILKRELPNAAIVSVGHRQGLIPFHDRILDLGAQ